MSDPIFARTRHTYDSYQDFWHLVELSGFPTIYTDEIDPDSDNTYIYTPNNGEITGWPGARARIIHFQLEWCVHPNDRPEPMPGVAETWTMDAWHAAKLGAKYVPIGSHPGLRHDTQITVSQWYDVAMMAYLSPRRQPPYVQMQEQGLRITPNAWGGERDVLLKSSRAMIHIHQYDDVPGVAALRVALAAAYSLPYISETVDDAGIFGNGNMLFSDYANLVDFTKMWVCRNERRMLEDYGRSLHRLLCHEMTFRKCVEAAL